MNSKEKLVFIYLITNSNVNICGIYELPDRYIKFDLDLNQSELDIIKQKFMENNKIMFINGWIKIINYETYNKFTGEKNEVAKEKELSLIPKNIIEYRWGIDRVSSNLDTLNNQNQNININKNQKKSAVTEVKFNYTKGVFEGITDDYKSELKKQYPNCNIDMELKRMADWLIDKPADDPDIKKQGKRTFINDWLKNNYTKPAKESENKYSEIKDNMPTLTEHLRKGE